ncbi:MAG: VWA domain-containing protein [Lachnospiraceae bacterium]|nr:VWA domain-containing protein [Lachnospiraceae bacterium]
MSFIVNYIGILVALLGLPIILIAILGRKKISRRWLISLIVTGVLLIIIGIYSQTRHFSSGEMDNIHTYVSLSYLEQSDTDAAVFHLRKVEKESWGYLSTYAILEKERNSNVDARLRYDSAKGLATSDEQKRATEFVNYVSPDNSEATNLAINSVRNAMEISEREIREAERLYSSETGYEYYDEGDGSASSIEERLKQTINLALRGGSYYNAVSSAAELANTNPSDENMLLLAETVAESVYAGEYLNDSYFNPANFSYTSDYAYSDSEMNNDMADYDNNTGDLWGLGSEDEENFNEESDFNMWNSQGENPDYSETEYDDPERASLQKQIQEYDSEITTIDSQLNYTENESKKKELTEERAEKNTEREALQNSSNYLYAERALNSIANQHSMRAEVVRARLRYSMKQYEEAINTLMDADKSIWAKLNPDPQIEAGIESLRSTYESDGMTSLESPSFKDKLMDLLSQGTPDMIGIATSPMSKDFSQYIVYGQKKYGDKLYVSNLNLEGFPNISVTLGGNEETIAALKEDSELVVKDTHKPVEYSIRDLNNDESSEKFSICAVVDESGSMGGSPSEDLKEALHGFVDALNPDVEIGIIGFENMYREISPLKASRSVTLSNISEIHASGGTNITAGIEGAMTQLETAFGRKTIYLMTDGQSDINMDVVNEAATRGIIINTIGFGDVNDELLREIAEATGGQYIHADSSDELIHIYLSLVGSIGTEIVVSYRVEDADLKEGRYFFIRSPKAKASIHCDYSLEEETTSIPVSLNSVYPAFISQESLESYREDNRQFDIVLEGTGLDQIKEVTIGGQKAVINTEQETDGSKLLLQINPTLNAGNQTIVLTDNKGDSKTFEDFLYVGAELERRYVFQIGELYLEPQHTIVMGNRIILQETEIGDEDPDNRSNNKTLSARSEGLILMDADSETISEIGRNELAEEDRYKPVHIRLNNGSSLQGTGLIHLNSNDYGMTSSDSRSDIIASGSYTIEYDQKQGKIRQK